MELGHCGMTGREIPEDCDIRRTGEKVDRFNSRLSAFNRGITAINVTLVETIVVVVLIP